MGPACWLLHGKAVGIGAWWGLGYVTPEDGTGLPGLEAIATHGVSRVGSNHNAREQHGLPRFREAEPEPYWDGEEDEP